jgi:hypothetical protein
MNWNLRNFPRDPPVPKLIRTVQGFGYTLVWDMQIVQSLVGSSISA